MSTGFPAYLDTYTVKNNGDTIQPAHVNDIQDAVSALEAKVGVDGSSVATSLTKKVADLQAVATVLQERTLAPVLGWETSPKVSGRQAITGIGFRPRTIVIICCSDAIAENHNKTCIGFHSNANEECSLQVDAKVLGGLSCMVYARDTNGNEYQVRGQVVSLDSDGFTISWEIYFDMANAVTFIYLALP